jgi:acetyl esterase
MVEEVAGPASPGLNGHRRARVLRWARRIVTGLILLILLIVLAFQVSYWPTTLLLRYSPDLNGTAALEALEKHVPDGVTGLVDEQYRPGDPDGRLDAFWPEDTTGALPVVVWVHGGAFVAGTKDGTTAYLKILAAQGYATVSVEYTKAPEAHYPHQIEQVAAALKHVVANAERFHADPDRIVLAGDSAGALLAAQTTLAISDDGYAAAAGLPQPIERDQLVGTILACGAYDLTIPDYSDGLVGRLQRDILWAYTGEKGFDTDPQIGYASIPQHVTPSFPPVFITAGNGDPLEPHSRSLAEALAEQGVAVDTLFFPADREPTVGHEYQFDLDQEPGQHALERITGFLAANTG